MSTTIHEQLPETLEHALDHAWLHLELGVKQRKHGFHLATLATLNNEGSPDARTVTLRVADRASNIIGCNSDIRAPKFQEAIANPNITWCFYDREQRVQVRAYGTATPERATESDAARAAWEQATFDARRCYLAPHAPSDESGQLTPNLPEELVGKKPTEQQTLPSVNNFGIIRSAIHRIDWLLIRHSGHRRARFDREQDGSWASTWVNP